MDGSAPIPFLDMATFMTDLFLLPIVAWDIRSRGWLHPTTFRGALAIVTVHALRMPLGSTGAWQTFAAWSVQLLG